MKEFMRVLKFTLFSISAGIIQAVSTALATWVMPADEQAWICYAIGLILSVLWNFTLNRKFTFKSANNVTIAMLKVAAFYAVFAPVSIWMVDWLVVGCEWEKWLADALMMILNFMLEFVYDRFFVFGTSIDTAEKEKK